MGMTGSLARSITLVISAILAVLAIAPTANAATLPGRFYVEQIHGNYAWGRIGNWFSPASSAKQRLRVDLRTGARHKLSTPDGGRNLSLRVSSDTAVAGIKSDGSGNGGEQLIRYGVRGGYQVLDSLPFTQKKCRADITPLSIEKDGTVIAVKRSFVDISPPTDLKCRLDVANSHVIRYLPGTGASEKVWLPEKYRPWLSESEFAASGDTFAIARSATADRPGAIVMLDTKRHKILAKRRASRPSGTSFVDSRSMYYSDDRRKKSGKLLYWRIGRQTPRVVFRGRFASARSCGKRAAVVRGTTLKLLTKTGATVLTRKIGKYHFFSNIACSNNYLHFLDLTLDDDYPSTSVFARHVVNTSRLAR